MVVLRALRRVVRTRLALFVALETGRFDYAHNNGYGLEKS